MDESWVAGVNGVFLSLQRFNPVIFLLSSHHDVDHHRSRISSQINSQYWLCRILFSVSAVLVQEAELELTTFLVSMLQNGMCFVGKLN